ncbi:MAG: GNAT family N-acetyltransferase [Lachnospiraceae bacterium]|nr:GNAT family N-acetyltransferase [Lachnospiraceae bacterium]
MAEIIKGNTVFLKPIDESDTDNIVRWRNSDAVRLHFIDQRLFTRESHTAWLENFVRAGKVEQFVICMNEGNIPVGSVYIRDIDFDHRKAEYGIFIGEDAARGKGVGTEAAKLMILHAFRDLKLHRLFLRVYSDNEQAIRSYEKAGFVKEALLHDDVFVNGVYRDIVLMGIINPNAEK